MPLTTVINKLNELKKMIRDISVNEANDELTEFILLTVMSEIELRKDENNLSEIEVRMDEAILKLNMYYNSHSQDLKNYNNQKFNNNLN